ncbi:MAG: hypothetical protein KUG76_00050 [Gammaproteobacteria bacterium]|nr:hypothetical protein [Gammaproteobacteria bacterium]
MFETKAATLILIQIFILLTFIITALIASTLHYKKKAQSTSLAQTLDNPISSPEDTLGDTDDSSVDDTATLTRLIEEEIEACAKVYKSISGSDIPDEIPPKTEKKLLPILIRHAYLKTELEAVVVRNDSIPFWEIMTPALLALGSTLPSKKLTNMIQELKGKVEKQQQEAERLQGVEKIFYALQKLFRDSIPVAISSILLPLTKEIELLNQSSSSEEVIASYRSAFEALSEGSIPTDSPAADSEDDDTGQDKEGNKDKNANDAKLLNQVTKDQAKDIKVLESFVFELQEQGSVPSEQLEQYHNFVITMKKRVAQTDIFISTILDNLSESDICSQFLESELQAAQEAVKTLIENIEDDHQAAHTSNLDGENEEKRSLVEMIERFAMDSREMMQAVHLLEDDNATLRARFESGGINDGEGL